MNKKFFAALASATMAFTASGSIAVFADDFVEENTPSVEPGDLIPVSKEVVWNKDNFGALVTLTQDKFDDYAGGQNTLKEDEKVKAADLAKVTNIDLSGLDGEIKGLEYFTGLTKFDDTTKAAKKITNKTLDFTANTALTEIKITKAADLAEITLPEADADENYHLATLDLEGTALTDLDLSKQEVLKDLTVKNSKLGKLDLSALTLEEATVTGNYNLAEVALNNGRKGNYKKITTLDLSNNSLETVNLDYIEIETTLSLDGNHIGALDLSKTKAPAGATLGTQTFYVSEQAKNVNLKEAISGLKATKVTPADPKKYDEETGVLTIDGADAYYYYNTEVEGATTKYLVVSLTAANPMNRLYNPNSGEHFYTANIKEKEALVALGWNDEGYGWVAAPTKGATEEQAVYRLYNPNAGDHHYTMDENEVKTLKAYGWKDEGTGWYSANTGDKVAVYRQYNPYANGAGSHNYTPNKAENDYLVSLGWTPEGTAWYGLK